MKEQNESEKRFQKLAKELAAKAKAVKDALKAASGELEVTTDGPYTGRIRIRIEYLSLLEGVGPAA